MIALGVTGSRKGCTVAQYERLRRLLADHAECFCEIHHGACVGVDEQVVLLAGSLKLEAHIVAYPANFSPASGLVSMVAIEESDEVKKTTDPLVRNRDIVDATSALLACPDTAAPARSGTWSTIRYARMRDKLVVVIDPEGTVSWEDHRPPPLEEPASSVVHYPLL